MNKDDHQHDDQKKKTSCQGCGCCGPTEFDFPEEFMTPEIKAMKANMSKEEFSSFMKALMSEV